MTFSPHLCLDFCTTLLTSEPWETEIKLSIQGAIESGNEIFLFNAYMFAFSDAHFPNFLLYAFACLILAGFVSGEVTLQRPGGELDESAVCLFVFSVENDAITPVRHLSLSP